MTPRDHPPTHGLAPVCAPGIRTLVLGSLPSRKSVELQQYYGHPQNAFWKIMGELLDIERGEPYHDRLSKLLAARIGVWDVLRSSVRPGSMDADIDESTAVVNDFDEFLDRYPTVTRICFNGRTAAELFKKRVRLADARRLERIDLVRLPSTSPAYASMPFEEKLARWSVVIQPTDMR